ERTSRPAAPSTDLHRRLERRKGDVPIGNLSQLDELAPGLELPVPPARHVEIFVKNDDRPSDDAFSNEVEHRLGGLIGVTVNVQQRKGLVMLLKKPREGFVEPAGNKLDVGGDRRQLAVAGEVAGIDCCSGPSLFEAPKAIEAEDLACSQSRRDV